ncbi:MAG: membrane protein insertion efficiency factor YidD [bacterium]
MIKVIILKLIMIYQVCISPLFLANCRFIPTCSTYAYQSIQKYGLIKGAWQTLKRLARCHPLGSSGYDPA